MTRRATPTPPFPCPCCGHATLTTRSEYEICPVCFWEDDGTGAEDATRRSGPNHLSLAEAQRTFAQIGAVHPRHVRHVRPPRPDEPRDAGWRPGDAGKGGDAL